MNKLNEKPKKLQLKMETVRRLTSAMPSQVQGAPMVRSEDTYCCPSCGIYCIVNGAGAQ